MCYQTGGPLSGNDIDVAHARLSRRVLDLPGVTGTAIGLRGGKRCLIVYVSTLTGTLRREVPRSFRGFPVVIQEAGTFEPR